MTLALASCFSFFAGYWLRAVLVRPASRDRRRGGYVRPPASSPTSPVDGGRSGIRRTPADSSFSTPPGAALLERARRPTLARTSKGTVRILFGAVTEDRGGNGRTPGECAGCGDDAA